MTQVAAVLGAGVAVDVAVVLEADCSVLGHIAPQFALLP